MLLLTLLLAAGAGVTVGQKSSDADSPKLIPNFLEYTRRCEKQLVYLTVSLSSLPHDTFQPYANTSAESEAECARKCVERTVFCHAARFLHLENICQFSAKYINCNLGLLPQLSPPQSIIHCIQCGAQSVPRSYPSPPTIAPVRPTTVRSNFVPIAPQSSTQPPVPNPPQRSESEAIPSLQESEKDITPSLQENENEIIPSLRQSESETVPSLQQQSESETIPPLSPDTSATQAHATLLWRSNPIQLQPLDVQTIPPLSPLTLSNSRQFPALNRFVEADLTTTTTPEPQPTLSKKQSASEEFVDFGVEGINAEEQEVTPSPTGCSQEMMKPCVFGFGRDCKLTTDENTGCPVCACPYKSPARGCGGPQGLKVLDRFDMLMGREPCPTDHYMQIVERFYRKVDKAAGIDECYPEKEPYCGWQQDVNIWRMPRTLDECYYFCYNDDELRSRNIIFRH